MPGSRVTTSRTVWRCRPVRRPVWVSSRELLQAKEETQCTLPNIGVTGVAAIVYAYAAVLNFTHSKSVAQTAERLGVPSSWMVPLGCLLAAGSIGLAAGFAAPVLGTAAACGLVLYFVGAATAHLRAREITSLRNAPIPYSACHHRCLNRCRGRSRVSTAIPRTPSQVVSRCVSGDLPGGQGDEDDG